MPVGHRCHALHHAVPIGLTARQSLPLPAHNTNPMVSYLSVPRGMMLGDFELSRPRLGAGTP